MPYGTADGDTVIFRCIKVSLTQRSICCCITCTLWPFIDHSQYLYPRQPMPHQIQKIQCHVHWLWHAGCQKSLVNAWRNCGRRLVHCHGIVFAVLVMMDTFDNITLHRVSKKQEKYNHVKLSPNLTIFGTKMANCLKLYEVHSFSTSSNSRQCTTVLNEDVPNCYITL